MISPEEYIKRYRRCNSNSMFQKDISFVHIVNSLYIGSNMHFIEIYSSNIYPQYIRLGDQHLFLWDNFYWDLLEAHSQCKILLLEDKNNLDFCKIYFTGMVYLFLAFRLERYPYLSLAISEEAQIWRNQISLKYHSNPALQHLLKVAKANIDEQILICKLFVFLHEYTHFLYSNPNNFVIDKKNLMDFCKKVLPVVKANQADKFLIHAIEELSTGKDQRLLEETCCDLRATAEVTKLFNKLFDTKATIDKAHQFVLAYIEEVQRFQHLVMQIEQMWQAFYLSYFDRNEFNKKRTKDQALAAARFQFIYLASRLLPEFISNFSITPRENVSFLSGYGNEEYSDFFNAITSFFCNEQTLLAINARGICLEYVDKLSPQDALQKRDKLLGWQL